MIVYPAPVLWIHYTSPHTKEKRIRLGTSGLLDLSSKSDGKRKDYIITDGNLCYLLISFLCPNHESLLFPLLRLSLCGRNKAGGIHESLLTVVKALWFFCLLLRQSRELSEAEQCRGILVQYDFIGQLYEILPTLYIVKAQAVVSMQQFISAQGYITEQVMAVGQLNPCMNHCPNT